MKGSPKSRLSGAAAVVQTATAVLADASPVPPAIVLGKPHSADLLTTCDCWDGSLLHLCCQPA